MFIHFTFLLQRIKVKIPDTWGSSSTLQAGFMKYIVRSDKNTLNFNPKINQVGKRAK